MKSFIVKMLKNKILGRSGRAVIRVIKAPLRKWVFSTATGKLGLKIVTRREIFNNSEKYNVLQFGSEESIVASKPYNSLDKLPSSIISAITTFNLEKPFLFEVENAELFGSASVGFDEDGNIISETVTGTPATSLKSLPVRTLVLKKLPSFGAPQLDTVCSLVNPLSPGYFHWLTDCLTRVEGCEYYQKKTGKKPVLIIDPNPPRWKIESLRLLGYEPDDCVQWDNSRVKVKRLVVPSFRRERNVISPAACRWLRQRLVSNLPDVESKRLSFSSRIYISRAKIKGRQVDNEDEVLAALRPFGFVAYTLENMSFSDEVRLFSQAEIVVAPHGAGLTNIIFAQKNLTVIEFFGSYGTPCFFILAKALGFHYGCLASDNNVSMQQSERYNGITVDIVKLRDLVTEMLPICSDARL